MYHCHICFYLVGSAGEIGEWMEAMPPLEHFTHSFSKSEELQEELAAQADVIFAFLPEKRERDVLRRLLAVRKKEGEVILLLPRDSGESPAELLPDSLAELLPEVRDIWRLPMSRGEVQFRFLRWQQNCKREKDSWQTSHYFETAINSIPSLVWYKDKNGIHEKVNDSFCATVNKSKEQVEGQGHAYIWDVEEDDPACVESEREVMRRKCTCVSEEMIKTGDGDRLLTTYKSPLFDLDGSVMGTVGVAIDITQERAYEQEIIEKNQTMETIFSAMDCGVLCHTLDGKRILSINRAALLILGYVSQDEMVRQGFDVVADSVLEEDRIRIRDAIRELKSEGESVNVEYSVRHENGELLHVMGTVKRIREKGREFYQHFLLDCTEQKIREKKNQRRQMELVHALAIDYFLVCFFELNTGMGMVIRAQEEEEQMYGAAFSGEISLDEAMETYTEQFVYEEDMDMLREAVSRENLQRELEEKELFSVNYRIYYHGEIKYFQIKAVRAGDWMEGNGIVLGFRSVDEDMRKEMEQRIMLEDALQQANRASQAKSVFLSNMSHDIRTPMNAIVGFTGLAISHLEERELVEGYLKKIQTSSNHLLNLINDVLDMSHIESGKMQLQEKPCDLEALLRELDNIVQAEIGEKQLSWYMEVEKFSHREIYCDKLRLNQVLLNLLSNAVKYTRAGGTVRMRVEEVSGAPEGSASYRFYVGDNGIGMSDEFIGHIFEPFERENNSTISGIQGTGLGMSITKKILDMMHGAIQVRSVQGKGSEFTVSLTFRLYCGEEGVDLQSSEKRERNPRAHGQGRILLVEDVELNQEIAVTILEEAGFSAEVASNGKMAVEMVKNSQPGYYRLVLMDIQMPVMNGFEATREIRKLENKELASLPIFAMTANAFEEDRQAALASGMDGHIAKPIDIDKLFEILDRVLT